MRHIPPLAADPAGQYAEEYVWRVDLVTTLNARWREGWAREDMIPSQNALGRTGDHAWVLYRRRDAQ